MSREAAESALDSGDLDAAAGALMDAVRSAPGDASLRIFLFQLFAIRGEWSRAIKQLDVVAELDNERENFAAVYGSAVYAEDARCNVWAGVALPSIFGEPRPWVAELLQALSLEAGGDAAGAHAMRESALSAAPTLAGSMDGAAFQWCADADTRLGPMFEIIVGGEYNWIACADISQMVLRKPKHLHDLVWSTVAITLANGGGIEALIPVRYPETVASCDPELLLARRTDFVALEGEHVRGIGQRLLTTDEADFALLELGELSISSSDEAPGTGGTVSG